MLTQCRDPALSSYLKLILNHKQLYNAHVTPQLVHMRARAQNAAPAMLQQRGLCFT